MSVASLATSRLTGRTSRRVRSYFGFERDDRDGAVRQRFVVSPARVKSRELGPHRRTFLWGQFARERVETSGAHLNTHVAVRSNIQ